MPACPSRAFPGPGTRGGIRGDGALAGRQEAPRDETAGLCLCFCSAPDGGCDARAGRPGARRLAALGRAGVMGAAPDTVPPALPRWARASQGWRPPSQWSHAGPRGAWPAGGPGSRDTVHPERAGQRALQSESGTRAGPADPSPSLDLEHGGSSDSEPQCVDLSDGPGSTALPGALVARVAHVGCRDTAEPPRWGSLSLRDVRHPW